ncbi:MAG: ankyrin repeat domain-containing protein [Alphaproteobacteria bacterium]|nr:ankyrin repeat domain-containing protein [Alphaproteobacteria bacterium]
MSLEALEARFLVQRRPDLPRFRTLARDAVDVADLWHQLLQQAPVLREGAAHRAFALGPSERGVQDERILDLHMDRPRPVGALPGNKAFACMVASAAEHVVEAEHHARRLAAALWSDLRREGPPVQVVWKHSSWGSTGWQRHEPVIRGLELAVEGHGAAVPDTLTGAFRWVYAAAARAAARDAAKPDRMGLYAPFVALWSTGCGVSAINDDCIVLFLGERERVPTRLAQVREKGADAALFAAAARCDAGGIARALSRGADPNARKESTVLHRAVAGAGGHPTYARPRLIAALGPLIAAGADPHRGDHGGRTPVSLVAHHPEVLDALVGWGVDLDARGPFGRTALHHVARYHHQPAALRHLLDRGADPNARDALGWTALHHAAAAGIAPGVALLLDRDADPVARTLTGRTPRDLVPASATDAIFLRLPERPRPARDPVLPALLTVPRALVEPVLAGEDAAWSVLADWLEEQGDPRGEAIALASAGMPGEAVDLLQATAEGWYAPLLSVAPSVEALLTSQDASLELEHGFVREVVLRRSVAAVPGALALLSSPAGAFVHVLRAEGDAGGPLLAGLSDVRSTSLRRLRIHLTGAVGSPIDLSHLRSLVSLTLRGPALEGLDIRSASLRSLSVHLPFLRNAPLGAPIAHLETPSLASLSLVLHRDPDGAAIALIERLAWEAPALENLHLRPASTSLVNALVESGVVRRLRSLRLDSMFPRGVQEIAERSSPFAHLDELAISVLDADREARRGLERSLGVLPNARLKGISYRSAGGYG